MKVILMLCAVSKAMKHLALDRFVRPSTSSPDFAFYCGINPP